MADVTAFSSWSTTAGSNAPAGATVIGGGLDENLREIQAQVTTNLSYYNSVAVASNGTVDLGAQTGNFLDISGVTAITSFGTVRAGIWKVLRFQGALTLTHNAVSLILPGAANITTAANDRLFVYSLGAGNWIVLLYQPATGRAIVSTVLDSTFRILDNSDTTKQIAFEASGITTGTTRTLTAPDQDSRIGLFLDTEQTTVAGTSKVFTVPSGVRRITVLFSDVSTDDASNVCGVRIGDAGGIEDTGYAGHTLNYIAGSPGVVDWSVNNLFAVTSSFNDAFTVSGRVVLELMDAATNKWIGTISAGGGNGAVASSGGGVKSLSGALTQVEFIVIGANFDAGAVNCIYE